MERRNFLKLASAAVFGINPLFAAKEDLKIVLPKRKLEYYYLKGKKSGGRILILGGIHGNEPGAYKAADLLIDNGLEKGELLIVPRSNFTSILANVRGYNGDMNRKFEHISKKDPDFLYVESLKSLVLSYNPDVVISMHDGYGFYLKNKRAWGQSVVIDELRYKNFDLISTANFVARRANRFLKHPLGVINTKTFSSDIHKEQKKAFTGWCLKHGIKAFCIEASKQLPGLEDKVYTHLVMLREFFYLYGVEFEGGFERIINGFESDSSLPVTLELSINGHRKIIKNKEVLKIKKGSLIEVVGINGKRGDFILPEGVNLNWRSFRFKKMRFYVKRDFKKIYSIDIKEV